MAKTVIHIMGATTKSCGKSTCALFLANSLIDNGEKAYIIDLDWKGTKWNSRLDDIIDGTNVYLTDLLYEFNQNFSRQYIQRLRLSKADDKTGKFANICIAQSHKADTDNNLGEEELDLYENIVYKVISNIIDNNKPKQEDVVNIILDMPSKNDDYSKRITNHLILDQVSPLYSKYYNNDKENKYKVILYLISSTEEGTKNNIDFFDDIENKRSYSSVITKLYTENRFQIKFIFNNLKDLEAKKMNANSFEDLVKEKEKYIKRTSNFIEYEDGLGDKINKLKESIDEGLFCNNPTVQAFNDIIGESK